MRDSQAHDDERTVPAPLGTFRGAVRDTLGEWWKQRPRIATLRRMPRMDLLFALGWSLVPLLFAGIVFAAPLDADAAVQLEMARSVATSGSLLVNGAPSLFYPPVYPLLLVIPGILAGFSPVVVHGTELVLWAMTVFSTYYVGSRIRRVVGLLGAPLVAINPVFLAEAGTGRATLLAALLFLWLFYFVRAGIATEASMGWAGILAGLLYLTKDTAGYISVLGIVIGFAWRVRTSGLAAVLRSRHYWLGGGFFLLAALAWAFRNELVQGTPFTNPSLVVYTRRFFLGTSADLATTLLVGTGALLLVHWAVWAAPSWVDPRLWRRIHSSFREVRTSATIQAVVVFLGTTVLLSTIIGAIFMRNEATEPFPAAVANYYRFLATSDPLLMIAVALAILVPARRLPFRSREGAIMVVKTLVVAGLLLVAVPATAAQMADQAAAYRQLGDFLEAHGVSTAYSEADLNLADELPQFRWISVSLDFSGPTLNYSQARVPDGATVVTVGRTPAADFSAGPYSVILQFDPTSPPVTNPFYVP